MTIRGKELTVGETLTKVKMSCSPSGRYYYITKTKIDDIDEENKVVELYKSNTILRHDIQAEDTGEYVMNSKDTEWRPGYGVQVDIYDLEHIKVSFDNGDRYELSMYTLLEDENEIVEILDKFEKEHKAHLKFAMLQMNIWFQDNDLSI